MAEITRLQELAYEVKIGEVMTKDVVTVTPQNTMAELRVILRDHRISGAPVVEGGELVGIISVEDLIKALAAGEMDAQVGTKMTPRPVTVRADESVVMAIRYFNRHGYGRFPVVDRAGKLVGILTRGDIIRGLLKQLEMEYHREEELRYRFSHIFEELISDLTSITLRCRVEAQDFDRAGEASSKIKRALTRLAVAPQLVRRAAIVTYELEMNIIIHTTAGGEILAEIQRDRIIIRAIDSGPGIPDIEQALQPGFSTAPDWVREMGFGAGVGLNNVQRCADEMLIESPGAQWTSVKVAIYLNRECLEAGKAAA
jgi:CBS domain-containing protein/anti-sigma regulatory factor (Ser/Thr protein kinase)